jgi:hypothetical protein
MREIVFRERQERVAHMDAICKIIARVSNVDAGKAFGHIVSEYAFEVFQESYDADQLRRRAEQRRAVQQRIKARRDHDDAMIKKLDSMEKMGKEFDTEAAKAAPAITKKSLRKPLPAGPKRPMRGK